MIKQIHHINFLVRDLEKGKALYENQLGIGPFVSDALPARGVKTARAKLGQVWIVLVMPTMANSIPGKYLQKHGEGFFLISFEVDDLAHSKSTLEDRGLNFDPPETRTGLMDWQIADVDPDQTLGALVQLTQVHHRENKRE